MWSPNVAWVDGENGVILALLPDGPVTVLSDADALLSHMDGPFTVDHLVLNATTARPDLTEEMARGVRRFVGSLLEMGFLLASRESSSFDEGGEGLRGEMSEEGLG